MNIRDLVRLALFVLLTSQLLGCGTHRWQEDVRLSDGRIINIKRTEKYVGGGELATGCWIPCVFERAEITFKYRDQVITWKSIFFAEVPMLLDIAQGLPVVVSYPKTGHCRKDVSSDESYTFYVYSIYENGDWHYSDHPPASMTNVRNLRYSKPDNEADLSIAAKDRWVAENRVVGGYPFYGAVIVDGISSKKCRAWK